MEKEYFLANFTGHVTPKSIEYARQCFSKQLEKNGGLPRGAYFMCHASPDYVDCHKTIFSEVHERVTAQPECNDVHSTST